MVTGEGEEKKKKRIYQLLLLLFLLLVIVPCEMSSKFQKKVDDDSTHLINLSICVNLNLKLSIVQRVNLIRTERKKQKGIVDIWKYFFELTIGLMSARKAERNGKGWKIFVENICKRGTGKYTRNSVP